MFDHWPPSRETPPSPEESPAKKIYVYVPFSFLILGDAPEQFKSRYV